LRDLVGRDTGDLLDDFPKPGEDFLLVHDCLLI
jgi:hypothetical protein